MVRHDASVISTLDHYSPEDTIVNQPPKHIWRSCWVIECWLLYSGTPVTIIRNLTWSNEGQNLRTQSLRLTISGKRGRGPVGMALPIPGPPCIRIGMCPLMRGPIMGPSGPGNRGPIGGPCLGPPGPWKCGGISGLKCGPCTPLGPIGPDGLKTLRLPIGSPGAVARTDQEIVTWHLTFRKAGNV